MPTTIHYYILERSRYRTVLFLPVSIQLSVSKHFGILLVSKVYKLDEIYDWFRVPCMMARRVEETCLFTFDVINAYTKSGFRCFTQITKMAERQITLKIKNFVKILINTSNQMRKKNVKDILSDIFGNVIPLPCILMMDCLPLGLLYLEQKKYIINYDNYKLNIC